MSPSPHVIETSARTFDADVLEKSKTTPVVLDFWAAWCQPCRRLGPMLEKLADEYAGQFVLVKADVDQLPQQAAAFRVEGIPAVFALRDGEVVDSFVGLLTEPQLREWLKGIVPSQAQTLVKEAESLEANDPAAAEAKYREAAALDDKLPEAPIGLARVLLAASKTAEARAIIEQLERRGFLEPAAERLKAKIELRSHAVSDEELQRLRAAADKSPKDAKARLALAEALLAAGKHEDGLTLCLEIVGSQRGELRERARLKMLAVFRSLGDQAELTQRFRRELSLALY